MVRAVLVTIVANGLAVVIAARLVPGITLGGSTWQEVTVSAGLVAVVLGLVNAVIRPVVRFFSLPLIWLTFGLFSLVVNALMLLLTSWLSGQVGLAFHVDRLFWSAILGGLIVSVATAVVNQIIPEPETRAPHGRDRR